MPTTSRSSPITTSAVNENRRPPLTTFATRLISTTRSFNSLPSPRRWHDIRTSAPPRAGQGDCPDAVFPRVGRNLLANRLGLRALVALEALEPYPTRTRERATV